MSDLSKVPSPNGAGANKLDTTTTVPPLSALSTSQAKTTDFVNSKDTANIVNFEFFARVHPDYRRSQLDHENKLTDCISAFID